MHGGEFTRRKLSDGSMPSTGVSYLLCAFFALTTLVTQSLGESCSAIPISLSNTSVCEDGTCFVNTRAQVALPALDGASACFDFISPDTEAPVLTANITIQHSHLLWAVDAIYFTDDPKVHSKGWCGCPGGDPGTCPSCNDVVPDGDTVLCTSGSHNDDSCFLDWFGDSGEWCVKTGLSGRARYKIYRLKAIPVMDTSFLVRVGDIEFAVEYDGSPIFYQVANETFNITVVSDTTKGYKPGDFVVIDMSATSDFYIMPASDVNTIDQFDNRKIGWYKPKLTTTTAPALGSQISAKIKDCDDHKFTITYPWIHVSDFLTSRREMLSSAISPNAVLLDGSITFDPSDQGTLPDHIVGQYTYLQKGWMFLSPAGHISFLGFTVGGHLVPECSISSAYYLVQTNIGLVNATNWTLCNVPALDPDLGALDVFMFVNSNKSIYGAGWKLSSSSTIISVNVSFVAIAWPESVALRHYFTTNFLHDHSTLSTNSTGVRLLTEQNDGVYNLLIEFTNLELSFVSTSVKPKIVSATGSAIKVELVAKSTTISGECYLFTEPPGIVLTQPISLVLTENTYTYAYEENVFSGNLTIGIRCYKTVVYSSVIITFDNLIDQDPIQSNETEWHHTTNPSNWASSFGELFGGVGTAIGDALGATGKVIKWWQYIIMIVEIIAIIAVIVVLIKLFLWLFTKPVTTAFRSMKSINMKYMSRAMTRDEQIQHAKALLTEAKKTQ